jgi:hypothetical protein
MLTPVPVYHCAVHDHALLAVDHRRTNQAATRRENPWRAGRRNNRGAVQRDESDYDDADYRPSEHPANPHADASYESRAGMLKHRSAAKGPRQQQSGLGGRCGDEREVSEGLSWMPAVGIDQLVENQL